MLYSKTITLGEIDGIKVENAIRKFALKRHTYLDFHSSSTNIGTDKLFLGLENESSIYVTRIRSNFEQLLPKLIIRFDKAEGFSKYRIRYSLVSNFVLAFICIALILNIIYSLINEQLESDITSIFVFLCIFLFLTSVELRLTKAKLRQGIVKTEQRNS